jgi:malate dehydrogenase (oxaloacetate-decarboxylating)
MQVIGSKISAQRIAILGAGSSAIGISNQLVAAMVEEGLTEQEARSRIWLIDSHGLVHSGRPSLEPSKMKYAQPLERRSGGTWDAGEQVTLMDVIKDARVTVLIGASAQPGAFTEGIVREMAAHVERPIIFPLSNPTSKSEAIPDDLIRWTEGRTLVATGSPFPDVVFKDKRVHIGQCNNSFIFPGVGLGVISSGARRVTDRMFVAAARALSEFSPARLDADAPLYPALERIHDVSRRVALAVAMEAQSAGLAKEIPIEELEQRIDGKMWVPHYPLYKRRAQ